ncbi:MAG: chemotaxis protein CheW [Lachnospiraceae bacterium]
MDVSQYLEIFIDETSEHIQSLSDNIMALESEPDNKDVVNEIFRAAHSLKGMAGTMGFKRMQHMTHDMENVFQEVRNDTIKVDSDMIDLLFQCLDAIEGYLAIIKETSDEGTNDNEAIIQKLNGFLKSAEDASAAKDAAPAEDAAAESAPAVGEKKFLKLDLEEKDKKKLQEAYVGEQKLYGMTVYICKDCLLKAARAFLVFKAVEEFAEIVVYVPSSQDIEDEKFENDFSIFFTSDEALDKIVAAAKSVSEIEDAVADVITEEFFEETAADVSTPAVQEAEEAPETSAAPAAAPVAAPAKPASAGNSAAAPKKQAGKPVTGRTVRVDIEKLDALMNQVSELIIAKNSLVSLSANNGAGMQNQTYQEQIEYLERITTGLHESVMKVRMVPIESVVNKFPRMIRDLSRNLNKKMELYMTGEETELDRTVVDQIGDPLQHLLRNSADHGLESAEVRKERGKPETGTITLKAFQEGNNVIIEVGDDGNGIDTEAVKTKAIERGIVTPEQAENLSQKEIIDFLFMPSFSMAKQITDISGRGVGLDVVKSNIEALGGDVEVKSVYGEGSTFTVRLPLTLAIIQALMVIIGDEKYAISLGSIVSIEDIPITDIKYVEAKEVINMRGTVIPIIRLNQLLDIAPPEEQESLTIVIISKGDKQVGLVVDDLMGQQEIVIKSLGSFIDNSTKIISGATILGDGEVALILDVNTLM